MDNLSEEEFKKMMENLDEKEKKTMNGFIDFFSGITNNNLEKFKLFDKNELEELRNKNAELRDELDKIGAELNKEKEKNIKFREVISNLNNNWVSKHEIKAKIEKLEDKEQELSDEQGYWGGSELQAKIEILEELLERE